MAENALEILSESMQMYIVTIARLGTGNQPVPLSRLAEFFSISPVSVNEMCRKLQDNGLVQYQPYKGALLTAEGEEKASYILRRHRLWEVFLAGQLGFEFADAHQIACQLEHNTSDALADRLDCYLGFPSENPIGDPIPRAADVSFHHKTTSLAQVNVGQSVQVFQIGAEESTKQYLQNNGLRVGTQVRTLAMGEDSILIQVTGKSPISLSQEIARTIIVTLHNEHNPNPSEVGSIHPTNQIEMEDNKVSGSQTQKVDQKNLQKIPLSNMRVGQRGIVVRVRGKGQARQRMIDMGMVPGSEVLVVRVAPLGDPIEFTVRGYNLSLRKTEAGEIEVEVIE